MNTAVKAVWQRCWCYRYGRCLVDCPTADLPRPVPLTDENWRRGYADALARVGQAVTTSRHDGRRG